MTLWFQDVDAVSMPFTTEEKLAERQSSLEASMSKRQSSLETDVSKKHSSLEATLEVSKGSVSQAGLDHSGCLFLLCILFIEVFILFEYHSFNLFVFFIAT